jgi:hypothetical protein
VILTNKCFTILGRKFRKKTAPPVIEITDTRKNKSPTASLFGDFGDWNNWISDDDQDVDNYEPLRRSSSLTDSYTGRSSSSKKNTSISSEVNSHEISATIGNVLQPENLKSVVQNAVNREVEKRVQDFFSDNPNFVSQVILSSTSLPSVPPAQYQNQLSASRKYRVKLDFF